MSFLMASKLWRLALMMIWLVRSSGTIFEMLTSAASSAAVCPAAAPSAGAPASPGLAGGGRVRGVGAAPALPPAAVALTSKICVSFSESSVAMAYLIWTICSSSSEPGTSRASMMRRTRVIFGEYSLMMSELVG